MLITTEHIHIDGQTSFRVTDDGNGKVQAIFEEDENEEYDYEVIRKTKTLNL